MTYENSEQLDRALKKAVRSRGGNPGDGYRQALRDRFLCRIFSDPEARFILKGGSGLLARIPDGRATRDIDFATVVRESSESALTAIVELAGKDMGDFLTFKLDKWTESLDENGYSRLLKLRFQTFMGHEEKDPILIDLSLDCSITQPAERIAPANRVCVDGLESCDYLVYPLPDQLADKLCAIMERHPGGWPSSRMKDLVDVVYYATNEAFSLSRSLPVRSRTSAPGETWTRRRSSRRPTPGLENSLHLQGRTASLKSMPRSGRQRRSLPYYSTPP